jgi:hypothetical protein
MTEVESHAEQSSSTAGTKRPGINRVFMIHLGTERMELKKFFKKWLAKTTAKKTPQIYRLRRSSSRHQASVSAQMLRAQAWA